MTAIIEPAPEGGFWAGCPEFPGANGQGETLAEACESLRQAIQLLVEDRLGDPLFPGVSVGVSRGGTDDEYCGLDLSGSENMVRSASR